MSINSPLLQDEKIFNSISKILFENKNLKTIVPHGQRGGFGLVLFVQDINSQIKYAVKAQSIINEVYGGIDNDKRKICLDEAEIMKNIHHKNIIEYHSDYQIGFYHFIQMNLCECSLAEWINERGNQQLSQGMFLHLLNQILDGIEYLHTHDYILRDLSIRNILISSDGTIKLCDFGLAKKIDSEIMISEIQSNNVKGVFVYYPPELIKEINNGATKFSQSKVGDIWAFGICLCLLGGLPFNEAALFSQPGAQIKHSPLLDNFCNQIVQFILKEDQKERPSISQIRRFIFDKLSQNISDQEINQQIYNNIIIEGYSLDYNLRNIEIEISKYQETEKECLSNLNQIESLIKLGYVNLYYHCDMAQSFQYFMDAMLQNPNDPDTYLGLSQIQLEKYRIEQKSDDQIKYLINKARQISPNYWRVHFLKFQYHFYRREFGQARIFLEDAMKIKKDHPLLKSFYYYFQLSQTQDAIERNKILLKFEDEDFPIKYRFYYQHLAKASLDSGQHDKSINYYNKELQYFPKGVISIHNLGFIFDLRQNYEQASKLYKKAIELNPFYTQAKTNLDNVLQKIEKIGQKNHKLYSS